MLFRTGLMAGVACVVSFYPAAVSAQSTTAPQAAAQTDVADIVVTARGRNETLISAPVVITAIKGDTLLRNNANTLTAIGELSPGVIIATYKLGGGGSIAMRGISSPAVQFGFEQAVSVAMDGVQTSSGRVTQFGYFDIDQVEVLKGPQALFFGKNSSAGVISFKSALPTSTLTATARASYEFGGDEATIEGTVSGPVSETLGVRVALRYRNLDGYLRNTARPVANPFYSAATGAPASVAQLPGASDSRPGEKEIAGRLTLQYEPSSTFSATLRVFGARVDDAGEGVATQNVGVCTGPFPRNYNVPDTSADCKLDNRTTVGDVPSAIAATMKSYNTGGKNKGQLNVIVSSLNMAMDIEDLTLNSITGLNKIDYKSFAGLDQTTFSQIAAADVSHIREFSQELRLVSQYSGPLNFTIGSYYASTLLRLRTDTKFLDSQYNAAANRFDLVDNVARQSGRTLSFFGQARWAITPTVELSGGARWTHEEKDYRKANLYGFTAAFNTLNTLFPGSDERGVLKGKFRDSNVSPEVTLSWRPTNDFTGFAAFRTGFKSGGFGLTNTVNVASTIADLDFESEKSRGGELGFHAVTAGRRLRLNGDIFVYNYKNLQVNTYNPATLSFVINNAGKVKQRGFEFDADYSVSSALSVRTSVAYVHNRFKDFVGQCYSYGFPTGATRATATPPPNCRFANNVNLTLQQVFDGRTPARSPAWTGSTGFTFRQPVGGLGLSVSGDAFYSSSYYASETLVPASRQSSFWRFNASVALGTEDERYTLSLVGRNLTNKYYLLYAADRTGGASVPGAIGEQRGVVSRGREVALQLSAKF